MEDFARQTGAAIVFPCYTLAPKETFPFQYEQLYSVLEYLVKDGQKHDLLVESIALAGDSVGGVIFHSQSEYDINQLTLRRAHGHCDDANVDSAGLASQGWPDNPLLPCHSHRYA